jgi:hypothetical protein
MDQQLSPLGLPSKKGKWAVKREKVGFQFPPLKVGNLKGWGRGI